MNANHEHGATPDEEALHWIELLADANASTRQRFAKWIRRSPEHLEAYLRQRALTVELQGMRRASSTELERLIARAKANKVLKWPGPVQERPAIFRLRARPVMQFLAVAAVVAIMAGVGWFLRPSSSGSQAVYSTAVGRHEHLVLPDGSTLDLNTQSSVRVAFSATTRDVYLINGEALFEVRHNATRPFRVHAGGALIEDLGTQFSVRRAPDLTMVAVTVIEGSVSVSSENTVRRAAADTSANTVVVTGNEYKRLEAPTRITAGQQIHIVGDGTFIERTTTATMAPAAWHDGRLSFTGATLPEIVAEFNRYNERKIILYGASLNTRRYSGVFNARDPDSFIAFLREEADIEVGETGGKLVVRTH